ncbi:hypothetical protein D3C78_1801610 [compost metagenome]
MVGQHQHQSGNMHYIGITQENGTTLMKATSLQHRAGAGSDPLAPGGAGEWQTAVKSPTGSLFFSAGVGTRR